ncbi:MAG: biopolymer transporter ExbD [Acidobacteria bacterium]|nr:biopolymer transporter ExbD [Acidobacteriota bacterium]
MKARKLDISWPMASMADIAFLLIVFFMLTSAMSADRGIRHALASDSEGAPLAALTIRVYAHGFTLNDLPMDNNHQLADGIQELWAQGHRAPIIVMTEPDASYQQLIDAVDAIQRVEHRVRTTLETHIATARDRDLFLKSRQ